MEKRDRELILKIAERLGQIEKRLDERDEKPVIPNVQCACGLHWGHTGKHAPEWVGI